MENKERTNMILLGIGAAVTGWGKYLMICLSVYDVLHSQWLSLASCSLMAYNLEKFQSDSEARIKELCDKRKQEKDLSGKTTEHTS
jgi:hypothetical protein